MNETEWNSWRKTNWWETMHPSFKGTFGKMFPSYLQTQELFTKDHLSVKTTFASFLRLSAPQNIQALTPHYEPPRSLPLSFQSCLHIASMDQNHMYRQFSFRAFPNSGMPSLGHWENLSLLQLSADSLFSNQWLHHPSVFSCVCVFICLSSGKEAAPGPAMSMAFPCMFGRLRKWQSSSQS